MEINAYENKVVGDAVNNAATPVFLVSQTRELAIRIVKRVGANKQRHADGIRSQITIIEEMSSDDPEQTREQSHARRLHCNLCEKLRQPKSDWSVKIKIENSFDFARLVSGLERGTGRRDQRGH